MSAWTRPKRAVHMGSLAGSAMVAGGRQGGELSGNVSALLGRVMYKFQGGGRRESAGGLRLPGPLSQQNPCTPCLTTCSNHWVSPSIHKCRHFGLYERRCCLDGVGRVIKAAGSIASLTGRKGALLDVKGAAAVRM